MASAWRIEFDHGEGGPLNFAASYGWLRHVAGSAGRLYQQNRGNCDIAEGRPQESARIGLKARGATIAIRAYVARHDQRFVYVLRSTVHTNRYYTGLTSDVAARLEAHNAGLSKHTETGRPWIVIANIEFLDATRADAFESYLKSGSGRAFALRHFR